MELVGEPQSSLGTIKMWEHKRSLSTMLYVREKVIKRVRGKGKTREEGRERQGSREGGRNSNI